MSDLTYEQRHAIATQALAGMASEVDALKQITAGIEERRKDTAAQLYPDVIYDCSMGYNGQPIEVTPRYLVAGTASLFAADYAREPGRSRYSRRVQLEAARSCVTPADARAVAMAATEEALTSARADVRKAKQRVKDTKARLAALRAVQLPE